MNRFEKDATWLLCDNNQQIIWIIGQRADERFKVLPSTQRILKLKISTVTSFSNLDKNNRMIVITGAAGFIGSCSVSHFNQQGIEELIVVDQFDRADKQKI